MTLLVGVHHGNPRNPVPNWVVHQALKIVEGMQPGSVLGLEMTPRRLKDWRKTAEISSLEPVQRMVQDLPSKLRLLEEVQVAREKRDERLLELFPREAEPIIRMNKMKRKSLTSLKERFGMFEEIVENYKTFLFPKLIKAAEIRGVKLVPMESAIALRYNDRVEPTGMKADKLLESQRTGLPAKDRLFLKRWRGKFYYSYEHLREKGFLTRLRREKPDAAFFGATHVLNLATHQGEALASLGITGKNTRYLVEHWFPFKRTWQSELREGQRKTDYLKILKRYGNRYGRPRRVPRSFRKPKA